MRTSRIRRPAILGVTVVVLLALGACDGGSGPAETGQTAGSSAQAEPSAEEIATKFLEAFGAFEVDRAIG